MSFGSPDLKSYSSLSVRHITSPSTNNVYHHVYMPRLNPYPPTTHWAGWAREPAKDAKLLEKLVLLIQIIATERYAFQRFPIKRHSSIIETSLVQQVYITLRCSQHKSCQMSLRSSSPGRQVPRDLSFRCLHNFQEDNMHTKTSDHLAKELVFPLNHNTWNPAFVWKPRVVEYYGAAWGDH